MHDPWDVAVTCRSDQYVSCMKINGVPLLPPVLSKECRKEMQYYKVLAREVEKRITFLRSLLESTKSTKGDSCVISALDDGNLNSGNKGTASMSNLKDAELIESNVADNEKSDFIETTDVDINTCTTPNLSSPTLVIGVIDSFKDSFSKGMENIDPPERDHDITKTKTIKHSQTFTKFETAELEKENICPVQFLQSMSFSLNSPLGLNEKFDPSKNTGPQSLTNSKSVDDIRAEVDAMPKLTRQSSYTILEPGPALKAHLEVQSLNSGVEMSSISMSDSFSNLSWLSKKRKSWDLETAKVKWNRMALELNEGNTNTATRRARSKTRSQTVHQGGRKKSVTTDRPRRTSTSSCRPLNTTSGFNISASPKTPKKALGGSLNTLGRNVKEVICKTERSPIGDENQEEKEILTDSKENFDLSLNTRNLSSNRDDPTECVRELYEKIRNQQLTRMSDLIEKQKREKRLLQQVFEEQNSIFYKQLKSICPTIPLESKEAWSEKIDLDDRPVSLSQLINGTSPVKQSPVLTTVINETQECLQKTDAVIRKGRTIRQSTNKSKKSDSNATHAYCSKTPTPAVKHAERSGKTGMSYVKPGISQRKPLTSDSSRSDVEPILTDRTDHTLADLNFTLTSEENVEFPEFNREYTFTKEGSCHTAVVEPTSTGRNSRSKAERRSNNRYNLDNEHNRRNERPTKYSPKNSLISETKISRKLFSDKPTANECAAATRIVAAARGYLARRLMRTERVQTIVQTIRDALVCAVELHEDREGIRGADVDLHRRLIQQITAACYSLHDTFVASSPADRCALIAQDRERQRALEEKQLSSGYPSSRSQGAPARQPRRKSPLSWWRGSPPPPPRAAGRAAWGSCNTLQTNESAPEMYTKSRVHSPDKYFQMGREVARRPWR